MSAEYCYYCNAPVGASDAQCAGCGQALVLQGRYRLARVAGRGGFGAVYQAYDARLKRRCAIKKVAISSLQDQQQIEAEVELLSRYSQEFPFLCEVDDYWIDAGQAYLVMEYVDGHSLDELLAQRGPLPPAEVGQFLAALLGYLAQLHGAGVVHRDLKPSNIRRTPQGRYVLLDLGIAKSGGATHAAAKALTLDYAPPEQLRGETTDARSDLYSLAATAYQLLTGSPPENAGVRLRSSAPLAAPRQLVPETPPALSDLIVAMLALDPAQRPASAQAALERLQGGGPDPARTIRQVQVAAGGLSGAPTGTTASAQAGTSPATSAASTRRQPPLWVSIVIGVAALAVVGWAGATRTKKRAEATAIVVQVPTLPPLDLDFAPPATGTSLQPRVLESGFGQDGNDVGVGFLLKNEDLSTAIHGLEYKFVAYSSSGTVLYTTSGNYVHVLNAGAEVYVADSFLVPEGRQVERVDIRLDNGRGGADMKFSTAQLRAADAAFRGGSFSDKVTGLVLNESAQDLETVLVSAVAFDEAGKVIGGGSTYLQLVPANGRATVEVFVTTAGEPARVELHPRLTISSNVE